MSQEHKGEGTPEKIQKGTISREDIKFAIKIIIQIFFNLF